MPATTRDALISVTEREFAKLSAVIEPLADEVALAGVAPRDPRFP